MDPYRLFPRVHDMPPPYLSEPPDPPQPPYPSRPPVPLGPLESWTFSTRRRRAVYIPPLPRTAIASATSRKSFYAPDEIWDQIVGELKAHDTRDPGLAIANTRALAALCRVNHQLERIVRPALWSDIHIRVYPWRRLTYLLDSAINSPALAELIHSIHLYVGTPPAVHDDIYRDIIPRLQAFCSRLRTTEEFQEKLRKACFTLFLRQPDAVDAVITLLAASAPSLKTLMLAPATEEYRVPSELKPSQHLPPTTLLAEFMHQSAVLALLGCSSDKRPLPLRHLKRVQIMNDVLDLSTPARPPMTANTLAQFCLNPGVKEFCGVGWNIHQDLTNRAPLRLVEGQREKLFLHLMQPLGYRDTVCHGLQALTLTDCSTSSGALSYLLRLFPSLVTLDITARPKVSCDWSFTELGMHLRAVVGSNLKSLRLRGWETVPEWHPGPPYPNVPRHSILGRLNTHKSLAGLEIPLEALVGSRAERLPQSQRLDYLVDTLPTSLQVLSLYSKDLPSYPDNKLDRRVEALMAAQDKFRGLCLIRLTCYCIRGSSWATGVLPDGWHIYTKEYEDARPFALVHVGFRRESIFEAMRHQ